MRAQAKRLKNGERQRQTHCKVRNKSLHVVPCGHKMSNPSCWWMESEGGPLVADGARQSSKMVAMPAMTMIDRLRDLLSRHSPATGSNHRRRQGSLMLFPGRPTRLLLPQSRERGQMSSRKDLDALKWERVCASQDARSGKGSSSVGASASRGAAHGWGGGGGRGRGAHRAPTYFARASESKT